MFIQFFQTRGMPFVPTLFSISVPPSPIQFIIFRSKTKSLYPISAFSSFSNSNTNPSFSYDDDDHVLGDCLIFDPEAFDDPFPLSRPSRSTATSPPPPSDESLIPAKWKEIQQQLHLTKKEKRKISHELRFASKLERKKKSATPNVEEYEKFRELKFGQLKPVVLDDPKEFRILSKENGTVVKSGRVAGVSPRIGMRRGSLEDLGEFFESGEYVPGMGSEDDDKKARSPRKLFTKEEKALLNKRIPSLAEATSSKWLPLHALAASGEFYLLDALLKYNVDVNAVDKDGWSAIHKAIICKKQAIINYLLRNSANPSIRDRDGATLMHYAVQTASSQTIKILLLYDVDINIADNDGWTPLHLAVQAKRTDILRLLLIKGADRTLKTQDGLTPLDLCLYSGCDTRTYELIKLLKSSPMPNSFY